MAGVLAKAFSRMDDRWFWARGRADTSYSRVGEKTRVGVKFAYGAPELVDILPEHERPVIESWMAGSLDRDISARLQVPVEIVARVRFETLHEVGVRVAPRPRQCSGG